MQWVATEDENGHLYYYNRVTDEVKWTEPHEFTALLDQLEYMVKIQQIRGVLTSLRIGIHLRLREVLEWWHSMSLPRSSRFFNPTTRVRHMPYVDGVASALSAWMRARGLAIRRTAELFVLQERLNVAARRAADAERESEQRAGELIALKVSAAEREFQRLQSAAAAARSSN